MADILIRGMEMPKHCIDCPLMVNRFDTDACALQSQEANEVFESWDDMRRGCPLLPLPAGHGRLGDLDALEAKIREEALQHTCIGDLNRMTLGVGEVIDRIRMAKTIVPAEGGGEE